MADPTGTPGSNADTSLNGSHKGLGAPKDKACPFCHQPFTSSSLGRHLDLYIKEKNPKPPDGIHLVDEIRKLRGGITRRQPRNSIRRRETSTPGGTPGVQERRSPRHDSEGDEGSPGARREDIGSSNMMYDGRPRIFMQPPSWEATGVMNVIPPPKRSDTKSTEGDEKGNRMVDGHSRSVSRQALAKSAFEHKQKMMEALDDARAAELALRELLGSLKAANRVKLSCPDIFDYDPLTLDFPALCLQCLPPPPTLYASTQVSNASTWNISVPSDTEYEALRVHFSTTFGNHRNLLAISSTAPVDDLSYPPLPESYLSPPEDPAAQAIRAETESNELELKINTHLHDVFAAWTKISIEKRSEIWVLELARSVGRRSAEIQTLNKQKEYDEQTIAHLRQQNDDLSRLQQPREFRIAPPQTLGITRDIITALGRNVASGEKTKSVGFSIGDRSEQLDTVATRAMQRWKSVIREARGATRNGLQGQQNLNGEPLFPKPGEANTTPTSQNFERSTDLGVLGLGTSPAAQAAPSVNQSTHTPTLPVSNGLESLSSDQDADADADMEEDESYAEMGNLNNIPSHNTSKNFKVSTGIGKGSDGMEGIITGNPGRTSEFGRIAG